MTVSDLDKLAEAEAEPPEGKAGVLESFITKWAAPVAGLHASLATVLVLSHLYPKVAFSLALPMGLLGIVATITFLKIKSGLAAAGILLVGLALILVLPPWSHFVIVPAVAALVALLMIRDRIGRYGFWWVAVYLPIIEQSRYWLRQGADGPLQTLILSCAIFAIASVVFHLRKLQAANIAAIFGFCFAILLAAEAFLKFGGASVLLALGFAMAVIWYGWKQRADERSDFATVAIDGLVHFLVMMAVLAFFEAGHGSVEVILRTWAALALVYIAVRIYRDRTSVAPRSCWASVAVIALVASLPGIEADAVLCVMVVVAFALQAAALGLNNRFMAIFSSLLGLAILIANLAGHWDAVSPTAFAIGISAVAVTVLAQWRLPEAGIAWWHGLMMRDHAARLRASAVKTGSVLALLPFAAAIMTMAKSLWTWVDYAGSGTSPSRFQQIVTAVNLTLFVLFAAREVDILAFLDGWDPVTRGLVGHAVWMFCGVVCYGLGRALDLRIQRFAGYLFVVVPIFIEGHGYIEEQRPPTDSGGYYAWVALLAGVSLATIGILRSIGQRPNRPAKEPAAE